MFVVCAPGSQGGRLAYVLETYGRYDGFRAVQSPVAHDAVETLVSRLYGEPIRLPRGGRYFPEDN